MIIHRLREPARPVIALESNNVLSCDVPGDGYRWYLNGAVLPGETARITPAGEGAYTVAVVRDGCWSEASAPFAYRVTGITTAPSGSIRVYPNPNAGRFRVQLPAAFTGPFSVRVVDVLGRGVGHRQYSGPDPAGEEWDLGRQPGNYFVIIQRQKTRYIQRVTVRP